MKTDTSEIRDQWHALKLEVLTPAALTDDQWQTIANFRQNLDDSRCFRSFCAALPFTVARFKSEAEQKILDVARNLCFTEGIISPEDNRSNKPMYPFLAAYARDTKKIHNLLFGVKAGYLNTDCEAGRFTRGRMANLHRDGGGGKTMTMVLYTARLGALPFEIIDGNRVFSAIWNRRKIKAGKSDDEKGDLACGKLRRKGILRQFPLGDVAIMASGRKGTLHCSSAIPEGGAYSAFFRVGIQFKRNENPPGFLSGILDQLTP